MERADLICRKADTKDSRVNRITLTSKGRHLESKVTPERDLGLDKATEGLSQAEAREPKRLLNAVYCNMNS